MDLNQFKKLAVVTVSQSQAPNSPNATHVLTLYSYRHRGDSFVYRRRNTINRFGALVYRQNKYSINGKGVCKRVFLEELTTKVN